MGRRMGLLVALELKNRRRPMTVILLERMLSPIDQGELEECNPGGEDRLD